MTAFRSASLLALCVLMTLGSAQAQGQWKWRDASGKVQYSDRPPPQGTPEKDILARPANAKQPVQIVPFGVKASDPAASAPADAASAAAAKREAEAKSKAAKESEAKLKAEEKRNADIRAQNCSNAKQQLTTLESGIRIARVTESGERLIMDDAMRAAEIQKLKAVIASECK
ncbi:DUF4124 domain-containing protein [Inhella proteolytica]|uniref:DUF4124 domain-containing protein n=1 Tax=Inhella proteolytica TaxID=2795029 RepID=A0A931J5Q5_9BURK|nr:DUF4124 domain-containing protein [Inhella proteolytica]MBH9578756.1 DUF4124 domain-containing protein [Inhella proteolytica]